MPPSNTTQPSEASDPVAMGRVVVRACEALGFAAAGVCEAAPTQRRSELLEWLAAGKHGEMEWLTDDADLRLDPGGMLSGARSMVIVADQYAEASPDAPSTRSHEMVEGAQTEFQARVARYAQGRDYHAVIRRRLHALADELRRRFPREEFRSFVDTAPVLEREHAARAGLGWIGKHTLLLHPARGSYLLLGGILTTLELRPEPAMLPITDHCGSCTRCIDACPTQAITPYSVDARKCISYLTIEHRSLIDEVHHSRIGDWLFGCDVCQDVCPFNRAPAEASSRSRSEDASSQHGPARMHPAYRATHGTYDPLRILDWCGADREAALSGTAMKRATLTMLKRNALIVLGNHLERESNPTVLERMKRIAADMSEPGLLRETAAQIVGRITR